LSKEHGLDRIFVEERVIDIFRNLTAQATRRASPIDQPFLELKDVFLWAVALGVKSGRRKPLEGSREGLFRWENLSNDFEISCLQMIALAENEDINVLSDLGEIQNIAEEYANEGIRIIKKEILDEPGDPLLNLANIARSEK